MADRSESIAVSWEELEPLRSVFLRHIHDPVTAEALRRCGVFLFASALEATTAESPPGSEVVADLAAIAQDLRWAAGYLSNVVAAAVEHFDLQPDDAALAAQAGAWAVQVAGVASSIEEAINSQ